MSSSRIHPHLCWFLCVIEDKWKMRYFAKAKQENCAKRFFENSKIEGEDILKNRSHCGWKYFETILLSRTKPYVHIFLGCWENRIFVFRRLLNATLYGNSTYAHRWKKSKVPVVNFSKMGFFLNQCMDLGIEIVNF